MFTYASEPVPEHWVTFLAWTTRCGRASTPLPSCPSGALPRAFCYLALTLTPLCIAEMATWMGRRGTERKHSSCEGLSLSLSPSLINLTAEVLRFVVGNVHLGRCRRCRRRPARPTTVSLFTAVAAHPLRRHRKSENILSLFFSSSSSSRFELQLGW